MRRLIVITMAVLIAGLGVGFLAKTALVATTKPQLQGARAYTIEFHERISTTSGKTRQGRWLVARRSDGSTVKKLLLAPTLIGDREIKLASEGKLVMVSDSHRRKSTRMETFHAHAEDPTCMTHPQLVGKLYEFLGTGTYNGFSVVKHTFEQPLKGRTMQGERWEAPDCNCEPVFEKIRWINSEGVVYQTTEREAVSITLGEPDPALFTVPDYPEGPPSSVVNPTGAAPYPWLRKADTIYFERLPK